MRLILGFALLTLCSAACSGSSSDASPPVTIETGSTAPATTTTTTEPDPTTSSSTSTSTTASSTTTTVNNTTTTGGPVESSGLALTNSGIGPLRFGARPEAAIEFLAGALGTPTADSGWGPSFSTFGTCPGTEVRGVTFGPLTVLFGDSDGERAFYSWTYDAFTAPDLFQLSTPQGVGLGTSTAETVAAYPTTEIVPADDPFPASARLDGVFATFTDGDEVAFLGGGRLCGE